MRVIQNVKTKSNVKRNGIMVLQHLILSAVGNRLDFLQMIMKDFCQGLKSGLRWINLEGGE